MWKPFAIAIAAMTLARPAAAEPPKVVVSIQPLHSLVAGVMKGVAEPHLLVTGVQSEHTYALKPSDARTLEGANLIVLVDRGFESFLDKPLKRLKAPVVEMAEVAGVVTLPKREGGVWQGHHHDHDHDHGHDDHHDHDDNFDGHVWLDPVNAKHFAVALAEELAQLDPEHAATYRANATTLEARLDVLDVELKGRLAGVASRPYVVFHDAYQYFEAHYGLSAAGSITVDPDRPPSGKRLAALRDKLKQAGVSCIFREPQFPAAVVDSLAKSASAQVGVLDPQGAAIPPGPDQYFLLMTGLAQGLTDCLSATAQPR